MTDTTEDHIAGAGKLIDDPALAKAIDLLENETGDWGSISMRLGDEYIAAIRLVIDAARGINRCQSND